ncbi:mitotic checkpoint serine/threonine-protein kinase BUB1 isoform X4 [Prunus dulcis]|uniref:mitotic checkpoint serine/threonine-protein kinase BUB1 isoform X4 n=1 Tax=Prunus dulcis TaxID=3755 RepID=UPI001481DB1A|nr:mitotic checkpoint serine/threonine-protein kinase BUB1 isoform X4 [Prunus dulcis]
MTVIFPDSQPSTPLQDPLLPWLWSVKQALEDWNSGKESGSDLTKLLSDCIAAFKDNDQYRDDIRFLKIWFFYMDFSEDFGSVFQKMWESKICVGNALLYIWYASFLESKGKLYDASMVYQMGISRNAKPVEWVKKAHALFLERMSEIVSSAQTIGNDESITFGSLTNPWSSSTMKVLLKKINHELMKYDGYQCTTKPYSGKVPLSSLKNSSRNKTIEIGRTKYQIIGCAGQGGFAQVYKAYVSCNPDDVVALKFLKSLADTKACFPLGVLYVSSTESTDLRQGTYSSAIILLMEHFRDGITKAGSRYGNDLTKDGFRDRSGPWHDQGLCLVDWGRGIDMHLFPDNMEFKGDCRTSGFRCVEMQENRPWTFQVDTYGLCVVVHMMLHNSYMEIEKKLSPEGGYIYQPKSSFKRYWNAELWRNLFKKLLNSSPGGNDKKLLQDLRETFQDYMCSDPQLIKKLSELLVKQRASLCA